MQQLEKQGCRGQVLVAEEVTDQQNSGTNSCGPGAALETQGEPFQVSCKILILGKDVFILCWASK